MFKVYPGYKTAPDGTSHMGEILVAPADLILAFGEPPEVLMAFGEPGESYPYKVSGEYIFHDEESGVVFTMYHRYFWKSTRLFGESTTNPEQFWALKCPVRINISGNNKGDVEEFKRLVLSHIKWVKESKQFEKEVIGIAQPIGLFLPGPKEEA